MSERIPHQQIYQLQPALSQALNSLDKAAADSQFPPLLVHLVKLRASQLNGCAFASACTHRKPEVMVKINCV